MTWRLRQRVRAWRPSAGASQPERALIERVQHLESIVEGLQDAVYRQDQKHDRDIAELRSRTDPAEIARALSEDARRRGL